MCGFSVDDPAEVFRLTHPRARKAHRCDCCNWMIQPGEHYESEFMVSDGAAFTGRLCACCAIARQAFAAAEDHSGTPSADWFREALRECFDVGSYERDAASLLWRQLYAGIVWRERAARREVARG